jgi:ribosomal-protein-alanine N-acetyltransferase
VALCKSLVDLSDPAPLRRDWRRGLPELCDGVIVLRELRLADARSLVEHLAHPRVCLYITPCPATTDGFKRFIRWTRAERRRGALACWGIVPSGQTCAVGVIQVWPVERDFSVAEWGFVLGEAFWGSGLFSRAARLVLDEVFFQLGVFRLEARAVDTNTSGNRVLRKLGATREGLLRGSFHNGEEVRDHVMWSILAPDWQALRRRERRAH